MTDFESPLKAPTVKAPDDLSFGTIDFNPYYKTVRNRGGSRQVSNINNAQVADLSKKLGIAAPKPGYYRYGRTRRYGVSQDQRDAFLKQAESYYNKTVGDYNTKAQAYNKAQEDYKKLSDQKSALLRKPLENIPDRNKVGRAAAESKGATQSRGSSQALKGNTSRAEYEKRMQESGKNMSRGGKGNKPTMGRALYEASGKARTYAEGGVVSGGPVQAVAPQMPANNQYQPTAPINVNAVKVPQITQNMNIGNLPAYTRTGKLIQK